MKLKDSSFDYGIFIKFFLKAIVFMVLITVLIAVYFHYFGPAK